MLFFSWKKTFFKFKNDCFLMKLCYSWRYLEKNQVTGCLISLPGSRRPLYSGQTLTVPFPPSLNTHSPSCAHTHARAHAHTHTHTPPTMVTYNSIMNNCRNHMSPWSRMLTSPVLVNNLLATSNLVCLKQLKPSMAWSQITTKNRWIYRLREYYSYV